MFLILNQDISPKQGDIFNDDLFQNKSLNNISVNVVPWRYII